MGNTHENPTENSHGISTENTRGKCPRKIPTKNPRKIPTENNHGKCPRKIPTENPRKTHAKPTGPTGFSTLIACFERNETSRNHWKQKQKAVFCLPFLGKESLKIRSNLSELVKHKTFTRPIVFNRLYFEFEKTF